MLQLQVAPAGQGSACPTSIEPRVAGLDAAEAQRYTAFLGPGTVLDLEVLTGVNEPVARPAP